MAEAPATIWTRWTQMLWRTDEHQCDICIHEVCTLVDYAIREGKDSGGSVVKPLAEMLAQPRDTGPDGQRPPPPMLELYAKLCLLTRPVNGRSLVDAGDLRRSGSFVGIVAWTFLFLGLALGTEILDIYFADFPDAEEGTRAFPWYLFYQYGLDPLRPLFWGGLGSCVFLLKRLTDLASEGTYTHDKLQGWNTRIMLGAVLGGILQYIFFPQIQQESGEAVQLGANAVAFLTGIGIRVVYGAIEKTVETLAEKLNLSALRTEKPRKSEVATFLTEELAKTNPDTQPDRRKLLLEMIESVTKPKAG